MIIVDIQYNFSIKRDQSFGNSAKLSDNKNALDSVDSFVKFYRVKKLFTIIKEGSVGAANKGTLDVFGRKMLANIHS